MTDRQSTTPETPEAAHLGTALRKRHVTMISLGGIIGAGLFVGSSATISAMGPAACLSYLLAGVVVLFVMRMLGEMAIATPGIGSFTEYTRISGATPHAHRRDTSPRRDARRRAFPAPAADWKK